MRGLHLRDVDPGREGPGRPAQRIVVPAKDTAELEVRLGKILKDNNVPGMAAVVAVHVRALPLCA